MEELNERTHISFSTVQLHSAVHAEVSRDESYQQRPLPTRIAAIVNDIRLGHRLRSREHILRRALRLVLPVIHRRASHKRDCVRVDPLPEDHLLMHVM